MPNNDILRKMYKDGSLVSVVNMSQEGMAMPANIETWTLDEYGKPISIELKSGVTSIPEYYQNHNTALTSCTLPDSITTINDYAFANAGNNMHINIPSGLTSAGTYVFQTASIDSDLTIPYGSLSAATSGYSSTWLEGFYNATFNNNTVTIEDGATIIPRYMFGQTHNVTVIVPSSVTFLSPQCFGQTLHQTIIVKFLGITPPNASTWTFSDNNCPFYAFNSNYLDGLTILVPSGSKSTYINKFGSTIGAKIETY